MLKKRIYKLEEEISKLPRGSIGKKNVKGKNYYYHRYSINGNRIDKFLDDSQISKLKEKIEKRKK